MREPLLNPGASLDQRGHYEINPQINTGSIVIWNQDQTNQRQPPHKNQRSGEIRIVNAYKETHTGYLGNKIKTSKYSLWNFLPKNLITQFSKLANCYFLLITFLQMIPQISISDGKPAMAIPLVFVLLVSMIKDIFEDNKRHKSDKQENNQITEVFNRTTKSFDHIQWRNLKCGQVIKVQNEQYLPADILMIGTSGKKGICYIETKNLDGETNLKHKLALKHFNRHFVLDDPEYPINLEELSKFEATVECNKPNDKIYQFAGNIRSSLATTNIDCGIENFLLRGSSLRNTDFVLGIIVYAGQETKVMMNSAQSRSKKSKIESDTNRNIVIVFFVQVACCILGSIIGATWMVNHLDAATYLSFDKNDEWSSSWILLFVKTVGTCNFVPISLLVTLEVVKFLQAGFIQWDIHLYDTEQDIPAGVQTSNLNEELGQVEYVFSDKTGTLTCNVMEFKKFTAGPYEFGKSESTFTLHKHIGSFVKQIDNVNFVDDKLFSILENPHTTEFENVREVLFHLALCHSIIIDTRNNQYTASSPDELALVNAAKFFQCEFLKRDEDNNMLISFQGNEYHYKLLNILEFNSTRKRMSVIVQNKDNDQIQLLTKGADSVILKRINPSKLQFIDQTKNYIDIYANEGLRTLLLAKRELSQSEYDEWNSRFEEALQDITNREEEIAKVNETIEYDLELIGSTAIEDRLQDGVGDTIKFLKDAGIQVWVLTGDKIETAINIGFSAKLLDLSMHQNMLIATNEVQINQQLDQCEFWLKRHQAGNKKSALIVGGDTLAIIENHQAMKDQFLEIAEGSDVVLACRVSPKQKADIVNLVKSKHPRKTTLAIGDGANDVNMITSAHVGVGIHGKEGQQASRSADYQIGQFQFLKPLLFIHGREAYRRNSLLVCYIFYKNVLFVLPQFWFGVFYSVFSGQTLYEAFIYQFYNIVFTAIPIMFYALFDFEHEKKKFLSDPKLYEIGLKEQCFGIYIFWSWIVYAAIYAAILLFANYVVIGYALNDVGQPSSFWACGSVLYAAVVIVANLKLFSKFNIYNGWGEFLLFGSIGTYFLVFWIENLIPSIHELYGVFDYTMTLMMTYLSLLFTGLLVFTVDRMYDIGYYFIQEMKQSRISEPTIPLNQLPERDYQQTEVEIDEQRFTAVGFSEERVPVISDFIRKQTLRKISLRKGNRRPSDSSSD